MEKESRKQKGNGGEERACRYLKSQGYAIVCRNWRTRSGEIDIIASKNDFLVFVEVKTLPSGNAEVLARELDGKKQKKIIRTSKAFMLEQREHAGKFIRYDAIIVDLPGFPEIYHIESAFLE